ncbi:uracil-DNA glycosylase [Sulfurimonas sp. HSL-1716]|uniref:uracil-DNA glycosylase n=1 Tax=Hydrocurvibacter sulfurireducens TaxID=3131937 RepID=UPI0031F82C6D
MLQNLYRLKSLGFEYTDLVSVNQKSLDVLPDDIGSLHASIASCHLCDLSKSRKQSMSGYGSGKAKLMIIDSIVSSNENDSASYYTGRAGTSLRKMVENVLELDIDDIFFTHAVKCKPLGSNKPSDSEFNSCKPYLFKQIELIKPKVIVTLGDEAYNIFSQTKEEFNSVRGHIIDLKDYKLVPIYHPQFLLRNPSLKKETLNDLKIIKSLL